MTDLEKALNLLDEWRKIFHNNNICITGDNDEDLKTNDSLLDNVHTQTARFLVDQGRYKEEDLFWTQEILDKAKEKAKEICRILGLNDETI